LTLTLLIGAVLIFVALYLTSAATPAAPPQKATQPANTA
jgi:hypothetical protein